MFFLTLTTSLESKDYNNLQFFQENTENQSDMVQLQNYSPNWYFQTDRKSV